MAKRHTQVPVPVFELISHLHFISDALRAISASEHVSDSVPRDPTSPPPPHRFISADYGHPWAIWVENENAMTPCYKSRQNRLSGCQDSSVIHNPTEENDKWTLSALRV